MEEIKKALSEYNITEISADKIVVECCHPIHVILTKATETDPDGNPYIDLTVSDYYIWEQLRISPMATPAQVIDFVKLVSGMKQWKI